MTFRKPLWACFTILVFALLAGACSQGVDVSSQEVFKANASITLQNVSNSSAEFAVSATEIVVGWTAVAGASFYSVERSLSAGDGFAEISTVEAPSTSYRDTGLTPNTEYFYRVRAAKSSGDEDPVYTPYSNVVAAATGDPESIPAPGNPSGLAASLVNNGDGTFKINLSWKYTGINVAGFVIERCEGGGCTDFRTLITIADAAARTYSDTQVFLGINYCYRVRAYNGTHYSTYTRIVCVVVSAGGPFVAPINLEATQVGVGEIDLTWQNLSTQATNYAVERREPGCQSPWVTLTTELPGNAESFQDTTAVPEHQYMYRVRAMKDVVGSDYAYTPFIAAPAGPYSAPQMFWMDTDGFSVNVNWLDISSQEQGFAIERCTLAVSDGDCADFTRIGTAEAGSSSYSDSSVVHWKAYKYRIGVLNAADGVENYTWASSIVVVDLRAPEPMIPTAISSTEIDVAWTDISADESYFRVWRCEAEPGSYSCSNIAVFKFVDAGSPGFQDTGLDPGRTYCYVAEAYISETLHGYFTYVHCATTLSQ
ncbi:MAG: fibronectin type III domain-containing protein [Pseudomonadota bacterium]